MEHRVLIVEDSVFMQRVLTDSISTEFTVIGTACNADEALEKFKGLMPDLVLLDISMPGRNGLRVLEEMLGINPSVKIIIVSALAGLKKEAFEIGAMDFVVKPFTKEKILETIRGVLNKS